MYSKIILNNWKSHLGKFLLMFSALVIALVIMTLLSTLHYGLQNYFLGEGQREKILRELQVTPRGSKLNLSLLNLVPQPELSPETVEQIAALPEVAEVLPTNTISGISSLQIGLLGQIFQTDALLFGSEWELLDSPQVSKTQWESDNEPYPAVVSTKLIDLYNLSFANANNLPQLTEANFRGAEITILLNESTFFARNDGETVKLKAKIAGFSPNTKLLGLTLPDKIINQINSRYLQQDKISYLDAIVRVHNPELLTAARDKISALGLDVQTAEKSLHTLESVFTMSGLALNIFFALMMALAGLLISTTFLAKITEKRHEIAILKTMGLTGTNVAQLYLLEALLVGAMSSAGGLLLAWLISLPLEQAINSLLSNLLTRPERLFLFAPNILFWLSAFTIFISCLFSFLPARKAAKLDPITILSK